jgi:hypothetical protein
MNLKISLCAAHDGITLRNFTYCTWLDSDKEATCSILWVSSWITQHSFLKVDWYKWFVKKYIYIGETSFDFWSTQIYSLIL